MKLLIVGDIHLGIYRGELSFKIGMSNTNHIRNVIEKTTPDIIVFLGDIFHKPKVEPEYLVMFNDLLQDYIHDKTIYLVTGNHDFKELFNGNLLKAFSRKRVNVISSILKEDGFMFIPYISNLQELKDIVDTIDSEIVFSHNSIGFNLPFEHIQVKNTNNYIFNGHIHKHYKKGNFINVGSVSSLDFSFAVQEGGIVFFDTSSNKIELYPNTGITFFTIKEIYDFDFVTKWLENPNLEVRCIRYNIEFINEVKELASIYKIDELRPITIEDSTKNKKLLNLKENSSFRDFDIETLFIKYMKDRYEMDVKEYLYKYKEV